MVFALVSRISVRFVVNVGTQGGFCDRTAGTKWLFHGTFTVLNVVLSRKVDKSYVSKLGRVVGLLNASICSVFTICAVEAS